MTGDFRTEFSYYTDPRTFILKRRLGNDALAALNFLWCWTAMNRPEGVLFDMTEEAIEIVSFWDGASGALLPTLLELKYLDQLEDGTYALHDWAETNPWVATSGIREEEARFTGMARNYPELYEYLKAQGITRISKKEYTQAVIMYKKTGQVQLSSDFLRNDCVTPAPKTSPSKTPEPKSVPEKTPKKTRKAVAKVPASSSSSFKEEESSEILSQTPQAESATQAVLATPTESKASIKPEKILVQGVSTEHTETTPTEDSQISETTRAESTTSAEPELSAGQYFSENAVEATVVDILTQWNIQLARLGFPQVLRSTARREAAFKARVHASQERIYLTWWVALFDKIAASDFMCESARQKANWLTLDWVLKEQNMMKILEGKYDSERPVTAEIHGYARTTIRAKTQPTTIRRLTHEEMSGPELYKWEVEHGYDAAGRKKSVVIEANVEDTVSDMTPPALDIGESKDNRETEEASDDFMDFDDFSYEEDADDEASYDYGTDDSNEDEDLTLYGDSGLPTIRRVKGVFQI